MTSKLVCIAWVREDSRPRSLALALGGESRTFYDLGIQRRAFVPIRYAVSGARTLVWLTRRRPTAIVMQSPPALAAALSWAWAHLTSVPIVLDTHPATFERSGPDGLMRPLVAWLAARSAGCIVTTPRLASIVRDWGGRPLIVHEAPMPWIDTIESFRAPATGAVLFVSTFAPDEPLHEVLAAAQAAPNLEFRITGDLRRLPERTRRAAPANVRWLGFLGRDDYVRALGECDLVMSLSKRPDAVQRSAHEAVDALRPLVISDTPHMRELFPGAVAVLNDATGILAGVLDALARVEELNQDARRARERQHMRWASQITALRLALGLETPKNG